MWWASHSSVRAIGLIDSLQRQPGWRTERPIRISPMSYVSRWPHGISRTSSGSPKGRRCSFTIGTAE